MQSCTAVQQWGVVQECVHCRSSCSVHWSAVQWVTIKQALTDRSPALSPISDYTLALHNNLFTKKGFRKSQNVCFVSHMGRRQLIKENYFIFKSLTNCSPVSSFLSGDNDCSHSCIFCQVFVAIDPPTMPWIARRDNKVPNRFPISQIALLNNARHSWILNFVILAAFSANQQSGTRAKNRDTFVLFNWISISALVFFPFQKKWLWLIVREWNQDSWTLYFVCLYSSVNSLCSGRIWFPHFWGLPWARRLKFWVKFVELCACGSARISFQFINKPSCTLQSPYTHFLDINMGGAFYSVSTVHPSIAEWKNCCREIARGILIAIEIWGEGQLQSRTSLESIFVLFVWRG